ncbi:hypothetical protein IL38_18930 [Actinopolyspora erythraea]|uniref:Uncharacterized protein n=1 Tax=Actinopolyspora erythraea TaxID=414996 RepID=A0ABR4X0Q2_9ACTN|nr:hypothetical protein IL38_18930 [Actinopolyspora erythraea]
MLRCWAGFVRRTWDETGPSGAVRASTVAAARQRGETSSSVLRGGPTPETALESSGRPAERGTRSLRGEARSLRMSFAGNDAVTARRECSGARLSDRLSPDHGPLHSEIELRHLVPG